MHRLTRVIATTIALLCLSPVSAQMLDEEFFGQRVTVLPEHPTADDEIVFHFVKPTDVIDTVFSVRMSGATILMIALAADTSYFGPEIEYSRTIGPLPAGVYNIEIHGQSLLFPIGPDTLITTRQLQVAPGLSSAIRVPTLSGVGLAALALGVVLVAGFSRRL